MKRISILLITVLFLTLTFTGCKSNNSENNVIKVGATPVPHSELLELVKEDLSEKGYELVIKEFTDYVQPNLALNDGELDANFFQHLPYLEDFNNEQGIELVSVANIHVEPLGVYSDKYTDLAQLPEGALISFPTDSVNGARALILLETAGLIKIDATAGLKATEEDIIENPKNLKFKALDSAQLPRTLDEVDASVINGNFAIEAGLNPVSDSIFLEGKESPYANIIAVRKDDAKSEKIQALIEVLQTEKVKNFILEKYDGGVVPAF